MALDLVWNELSVLSTAQDRDQVRAPHGEFARIDAPLGAFPECLGSFGYQSHW